MGEPGAVGRQPMRLRVIDHLKAMLDPAQKTIVGAQLVGGGAIDAAGLGEPVECRAGRRDAQFAHPAAPDQLLGLGKKFDLADAAAAGLDVVARDPDARAAAMRVDLALDRMNVLDRRKIEVFAPDKGLQIAQEMLRRAAGRRPPAAP